MVQMDDLCSSLTDQTTTGLDIQHARVSYLSGNVQLFIIVETTELCACTQKSSEFLVFTGFKILSIGLTVPF